MKYKCFNVVLHIIGCKSCFSVKICTRETSLVFLSFSWNYFLRKVFLYIFDLNLKKKSSFWLPKRLKKVTEKSTKLYTIIEIIYVEQHQNYTLLSRLFTLNNTKTIHYYRDYLCWITLLYWKKSLENCNGNACILRKVLVSEAT